MLAQRLTPRSSSSTSSTSNGACAAVGWLLILSASSRIHPGIRLRALRSRANLTYKLARARPWLSRWLQQGPHALLRRQIDRSPQLLGFVVWPFIHAAWPAGRRFAALSEHMRLVDELFPWLALGEEDRRELLPLDHLRPGLSLELDRAAWFMREGALVLNLFLDDHRLMSVAFSLAREPDGLTAYVGGLQGSNRPSALEEYRRLTKVLHGLRPRAFLLKMLQFFMGSLGVTRVLCVSDECRHHRHAYFGSRTPALFLKYDEVWQEQGGRRLPSGFFELAANPTVKPIEEVPSKKRAMYRRRYGMLAALTTALRHELDVLRTGLPEPSPASRRSPEQSSMAEQCRGLPVTDRTTDLDELALARR